MTMKLYDIAEKNEAPTDTKDASLKDQLKEQLDSLFTTVKAPNTTTFFTASASNYAYNIDGTILEPKSTFIKNYKKQLLDVIFKVNNSTSSQEKLLELVVIFNYIANNNVPIQLKSSKYKKTLGSLAKELNEFFVINFKLLAEIYSMFVGVSQSEEEK